MGEIEAYLQYSILLLATAVGSLSREDELILDATSTSFSAAGVSFFTSSLSVWSGAVHATEALTRGEGAFVV